MSIRTVVWGENIHERTNAVVGKLYPKGMHEAIADLLRQDDGIDVSTATMEQPEHGLPQTRLDATDVLLWWGHKDHGGVSEDVVERVAKRVWEGMGLIVLHSAHFSKIFRRLMGSPCALKWREAGERERLWVTAPGHPIGSFYGYEIAGVYKSESEALLDPVDQTIKNAGFFKYKDQNGDEVINENDKVYLGSPIPWLISGLDLGFRYRQFDLNVSLMGQLGNKILNAKRMNRDVFTDGNYDQDIYENRWTKDSPSDEYPSAAAYNYSFIQQSNDFFVESGSYIRIQNVQAGYTTEKIKFIPQLRIYISAQRPFTYFTYNGFTPEIGGSPISSGIDNSVYPLQAVYSVGIKANF